MSFALFCDSNVEIARARQDERQGSQFMVVRGEKRAAVQLRAVVDVFDDGAGDGEAVPGGGAAADFIEDDEAAVAAAGEDARRLDHLDHEGALARVNLVLGADAREDAVHQTDAGLVGGHEAADLCHQRDERNLADVGRLAGHVGAGDDVDARLAVEAAVVGRIAQAAVQHPLNHRMAPGEDAQLAVFANLRATVTFAHGHLGQRKEGIEVRNGARRAGQTGRGLRQAATQLVEEAALQRENLLFGAEYLSPHTP